MDSNEFNSQIETIINSLSPKELRALHEGFITRDCYRFSPQFNDKKLIESKLNEAVKVGISKINLDDLITIAPDSIKRIVEAFTKADDTKPEVVGPEHFEQAEDVTNSNPQEEQTEPELPGLIDITTGLLPEKKLIPLITDKGVSLKPLDITLSDTARRALISVMFREKLYAIPKGERWRQLYAHVGIDSKGTPIALISSDEMQTTPLSLIDLTSYLLCDVYVKFKDSNHKKKTLEIECDMLRQANENLQQKAQRYERELFMGLF